MSAAGYLVGAVLLEEIHTSFSIGERVITILSSLVMHRPVLRLLASEDSSEDSLGL
jgi:hypothetical protein